MRHHPPPDPQRRQWLLGSASFTAAMPPATAAASPIEAVYPRMPERPVDGYAYQLLRLALEASGQPFRLRLTAEELPSVRAFKSLESGEFNVMDAGAAPRLAERAEVLPFPLDLGLCGYRVMLVRRDRVAALRQVHDLTDLRRLSFGQGPDWVDNYILRAAGLSVQEAEFLALFRMLEAGRFDAFPLGADEAGTLLDTFRHLAPSVVVLEDWCLHYRFARVLVVRRGQPALRQALSRGLQAIFNDGRAQALLRRDARLGPVLTGQRPLPERVLQLPNPQWTRAFDAIPEPLMFMPGRPAH
ncbi:substrate-binding periplasmic protein [Roseateles sp. BYS87W]|uniref:Substrate-binding periplasmic protein n=1 Tax=Pelomonas baiyunensis TaxID=3299026 RepID=A0ABW7GYY4_9BURK